MIHAWRVKPSGLMRKALDKMNRVDMGVALVHIYVANPKSFRFFQAEQAPERKGYASRCKKTENSPFHGMQAVKGAVCL